MVSTSRIPLLSGPAVCQGGPACHSRVCGTPMDILCQMELSLSSLLLPPISTAARGPFHVRCPFILENVLHIDARVGRAPGSLLMLAARFTQVSLLSGPQPTPLSKEGETFSKYLCIFPGSLSSYGMTFGDLSWGMWGMVREKFQEEPPASVGCGQKEGLLKPLPSSGNAIQHPPSEEAETGWPGAHTTIWVPSLLTSPNCPGAAFPRRYLS